MGLLDDVLNGRMMPNDPDPQGAMLADLLRRLEASQAPQPGVSTGDLVAQMQAQPSAGAGRLAAPEPLPMREIKDSPQAGIPYQAPETPIVPDGAARRESAMRQPDPAPAAPARRAAPAAPPFEVSTQQRIGDFFTALGGGNVPDRAGAATQKNATYQFLVNSGRMTPDEARLIMDAAPEIRTHILNQALGPKTAPSIVEVPGEYGQTTKMVWDAKAGKLVPLSTIIGGGGVPAPNAMPTPNAAPSSGVPGAPVASPAAPAAPLGTPLTTPIRTMPTEGDYVIGQAVPKSPEGYVHKLAGNGQGYLYTREGRPVFESKAEVDARGKQREKDLEAEAKRTKAGEQVTGAIEQLTRLPLDFGKQATERAMGPWSATDTNPETRGGLFGTGLSIGSAGQLVARGWGEAQYGVEGGASPTEVRDRVETVTKNLAAVMKPLIRAPGEGAWSDKDQANLEAQIGAITRSRSVEEYNRRLADIQENVAKVFKLNVPQPGAVQRSPNAPARAEDEMTWLERQVGSQ